MYLSQAAVAPDRFPTDSYYPFNLSLFQQKTQLQFTTPVTFFAGENGSGKSTLLRGICKRCGIYIWENMDRVCYDTNPYEALFYQAIDVDWKDSPVPGAYFGADIFRYFAERLDQWAKNDPAQLDYFGGKSLLSQSHGQSILSFFKARYTIKGIYFLDEPENALSPKSQLQLLDILNNMGDAGHAQFIIATHSPILLACPNARIYNFDRSPIAPILYEETDHYTIYRDFLTKRDAFI